MWLALVALYLVWGATYLANRVAVAELESFALAAARFVISGALLYGWPRLRGAAAPSASQWRAAAFTGALLTLGNACVAWAVHILPLGVVAVLVAMTPGFLVLFAWLRPGGERPAPRVVAGLVLGVAGIAVLMGARAGIRGASPMLGGLVVLAGTIAWAAGSIYSRSAPRPRSPFMQTATQMLAGGVVMTPVALLLGQFRGPALGTLSAAWWQAFAFLVVFGSIIGFSSYVYLLEHSSPAVAGSYAFVNPVIAALIGWLLLGEALTARTVAAFAVILVAVALIVSGNAARARRSSETAVDEPCAA
ncbi:MAG: EamA family transporter [Gemmatimonadaceae bacterium]